MSLTRRIRLRLTRWPLALIIIFGDLAIMGLIWLGFPDPFFVSVLGAPAYGSLALIAIAAWLAEKRGKRLRLALDEALAAHGDGGIAHGDFPDLPVYAGRTRLYCAGKRELVILPLEAMVWAYVEEFRLHPTWHELVIWSGDAKANVFPIRKCFITPLLERLEKAAPWLPIGYSEAMKESWNNDHRDFLALVEDFRRSGRRFDVPWAGKAFARVMEKNDNNWMTSMSKGQVEETTRLKKLWAEGRG